MKKTGYVILAALCLAGPASANTIDVSKLTAPLKKAYTSLGQMGLTIDKATRKFISGKYSVAVPKSAIIEDKGKSYVVILDPQNPSMSDRHEVILGNKSDKFVHTKNVVTSGDYVVVRKQKPAPKTTPHTKPILKAKPVEAPKYTPPRSIARVEKPTSPGSYTRPTTPKTPSYTYTPPPVNQRSYSFQNPPRNYQPAPSAPVRQPDSRTPFDPTPYISNSIPNSPAGCSVCTQPEPYPYHNEFDYDYVDDYDYDYDYAGDYDYDYVDDYYPVVEPYDCHSNCFSHGLRRAFSCWFN